MDERVTFAQAYDDLRRDGWRVGIERSVKNGVAFMRFVVRRGAASHEGPFVADVTKLDASAAAVLDQVRRAA